MGFLYRSWAIVHIVIKRIWAQLGLVFVMVIGLVIAISLVISIPLYADAIYRQTSLQKMSTLTSREKLEEGMALPLSFTFSYYGSWDGAKEWDDIQPFDHFITNSAGSTLGMPIKMLVRYVSTDSCSLYPSQAQGLDYQNEKASLAWVQLGMMSDIQKHIQITEGDFPEPAEPKEGSIIDVLVSLSLANRLGMQLGEKYVLLTTTQMDTGAKVKVQLPIRIAGAWQPIDNKDPYWVISTSFLADVILVPEETFANRVSTFMPGEVYTADWFLVMDGSRINSDDVGTLLGRIGGMQNQAAELLPGMRILRSPNQELLDYQKAANQLTILMYVFAIPIIGLILAFISLVASLSIERKRNEIAITRSRGATAWQVLGSIALESALLGIFAFMISLPTAMGITEFISRTRSFMNFNSQSSINIDLSREAWQSGLIAVGVTLLVTLIPAVSAIRHTIVSYKQERARTARPPWWQRAWLDALLLIPAGYGAYLLNKQGSLLIQGSTDPLGNPLLFLIPALTVLALSLLLLRLVSPFMAAIAWIAAHTRFVGLLLAARQLARSPSRYNTPLLILVFTLSLSAYTASLAQTLDQNLYARTYYQVGSDMKFTEIGEPKSPSPFPTAEQVTNWTPDFLFFPVSEYLNVPGIKAVTRVGSYKASYIGVTGNVVEGLFYGLDRIDFPGVAYWRRDFAPISLGALMNTLGAEPDGILVPRSFLAQSSLKEGNTLQLTVSTDINQVKMEARIVGSFDLFPTWYEEESGPLFVGNLDYLFEQTGGQSPYQVWVKTDPNIDYAQLGNIELRDLNVRIVTWEAAQPEIQQVQERPEQQGIFGFLFIGFAAAAVLTVVGLLLYALFSYQRRFIELGVLRAGGLSRGQMATSLAFELIFLIFLGGAIGTGLGVLISTRFIPFLQMGTEAAARTPPYKVIIAWPAIFQIYGLFGILFGITLWVLIILLQRMKIFQAIKLGETV
jgi:putative ABC transport system permease protein